MAEMISHFGRYVEAETRVHNLQAVNTDFDFRQKIAGSLKSLL
jgi:hypothetical protein